MTTPEPTPLAAPSAGIEGAWMEHRRLRLQDAWHDEVPVYRRAALGPGHRIDGPAIIEQDDATILVPASYGAEIGTFGDLTLTREG